MSPIPAPLPKVFLGLEGRRARICSYNIVWDSAFDERRLT